MPQVYNRFRQRYANDPAGFICDCVLWRDDSPAPYQIEIADLVARHDRVAVRGPRGLGKTALCALLVHWFALTRDGVADWKVVTTASIWRQLIDFLWPEIHKWAKRLNWQKIGREPYDSGRELLIQRLNLSTGSVFPVASNRPESMEGAHASQLLYIFDEAKIIPDATWDSISGTFSTGGKWFAISTPGSVHSRFYQIFARRPGYADWVVRAVTIQEAIEAGRVSQGWADSMQEAWKDTPSLYKMHVLGEFAEDDTGAIIPLSAIYRAMQNVDHRAYSAPITSIGVDVGGGMEGSDCSVIALASGLCVRELRVVNVGSNAETAIMQLAGAVKGLADKWPNAEIYVDSIGIGLGVLHRLRELGYNAFGFNAAAATELRDQSGEIGFANWRAAGWWILRELLLSNEFRVILPHDDDLVAELSTPRCVITSAGRIQVEDKERIRKRLGRSTDRADAVIHALVGPVLWREAGYTSGTSRIVERRWTVA